MHRFAFLFTLKSDAIGRLMDHPADRATVFARAIEAMGGTLLEYSWMFGEYDGIALAELPDSSAAAAVSLGLTSTGSFGRIQTHELFASEEIAKILGVARAAA
jgi:uncharacterized protein with GYD domain